MSMEMVGLAAAGGVALWLICRMPWRAYDFVVITVAAAGAMLLPGYTRAVVAQLAECCLHWWFWVLTVLLWFFGLIPFTWSFAIRRMLQDFDRMQRRQFGQWRRPSWAATVWVLLLTAFAARLFGWWV
jgi:hypothetical protein